MMDEETEERVFAAIREQFNWQAKRIETLESALQAIARSGEMAAEIMRGRVHPGGWEGAERVAGAFARMGKRARAALNSAAEQKET